MDTTTIFKKQRRFKEAIMALDFRLSKLPKTRQGRTTRTQEPSTRSTKPTLQHPSTQTEPPAFHYDVPFKETCHQAKMQRFGLPGHHSLLQSVYHKVLHGPMQRWYP